MTWQRLELTSQRSPQNIPNNRARHGLDSTEEPVRWNSCAEREGFDEVGAIYDLPGPCASSVGLFPLPTRCGPPTTIRWARQDAANPDRRHLSWDLIRSRITQSALRAGCVTASGPPQSQPVRHLRWIFLNSLPDWASCNHPRQNGGDYGCVAPQCSRLSRQSQRSINWAFFKLWCRNFASASRSSRRDD